MFARLLILKGSGNSEILRMVSLFIKTIIVKIFNTLFCGQVLTKLGTF